MNRKTLIVIAVILVGLAFSRMQSGRISAPVDEDADIPIGPELVEMAISYQQVALKKRMETVRDLKRIQESAIVGKVPYELNTRYEYLQSDARRRGRTIDEQITEELTSENAMIEEIKKGESSEFPSLDLYGPLQPGDWGEMYGTIIVTRRVSDSELFAIRYRYSDSAFFLEGWNTKTLQPAYRGSEEYEIRGGAFVNGYKEMNVEGKDLKIPILKRFNADKLREAMRVKRE